MGINKEIWNQGAADKEIGEYIYIYIYENPEVMVRTNRSLTEKFQTRIPDKRN